MCWSGSAAALAVDLNQAQAKTLESANAPKPGQRTILILGDSLSAAYGLPVAKGWVALLQQRLKQQDLPYEVVNASISGDTSFGGAVRLPDLLARHRPAIVVVELGANDALRGLSPAKTREQLSAILDQCQRAKAVTLLIGVPLPPNYGAFARSLQEVLEQLARERRVPLVPSLFQGFEARRDWFQEDGMHPVAAAQPSMLENVWPSLLKLLKSK